MPMSYGAPHGKWTTFHNQVEVLEQNKTLFDWTILRANVLHAKIEYILQISRFLPRKNHCPIHFITTHATAHRLNCYFWNLMIGCYRVPEDEY